MLLGTIGLGDRHSGFGIERDLLRWPVLVCRNEVPAQQLIYYLGLSRVCKSQEHHSEGRRQSVQKLASLPLCSFRQGIERDQIGELLRDLVNGFHLGHGALPRRIPFVRIPWASSDVDSTLVVAAFETCFGRDVLRLVRPIREIFTTATDTLS